MNTQDGGWVIDPAVNSKNNHMTSEHHEIFTQAFEGLCGAAYQPLLYLGHQLVAGHNHSYIALQTLVLPGERKNAVVKVTIYFPLQGTPAVTCIEAV